MKFISQKQIARLYALAKKAGVTSEEVDAYIKKVLGYESKKHIFTTHYNAVVEQVCNIPSMEF